MIAPSPGGSRSPSKLRHRQFLLEVADALRPVGDPLQVQSIVTRMLSDRLDASRVMYAELDDGKEVIVHREWIRRPGPSLIGRYPWRHFIGPAVSRAWNAGEVFTFENARTDLDPHAEGAALEAIGCVAGMSYALKKNGKLVAGIGVHYPAPRKWTEDEKALIRDVAERTWAEVQRAHSELALRENEEKYRSLFASIDDGFCILELRTDANGNARDVRFIETNPAFERDTGFRDCARRTYREITGTELEAQWLEVFTEVLRTGDARRTEGTLEAIGRWYEVSVSRIGAIAHRRLGCVFKDISERKKAERLMQLALEREQAARAVAEQATAVRDEFIGVVSHELRTPLSAIVIWANALRTGKVPAEGRDTALEAILTSANVQHHLVDQLLDVSRLTAGKMQIAVRGEDLGVIVNDAAEILRPTALARKVELRTDAIAANVHGLVDRGRLHQVLWNVIGNAIKFTPAGGHVVVTLRSKADAAVIEVKDDGIGIPASFLLHLFERFRQADMSQTRSFGGLGLGLSIARQLVEMHGGTITGSSEGPERGATFRIELPLVAANVPVTLEGGESGAAPFSAWPALRGRRILVVEDDSQTRAVLTWLLESCGAEVVAVAEGGAAREAADLGALFDALVCDLGLPGDDGCSVLRALRQSPDNPLPALALTAYVRREDRERALAAGFDAFLAKPIAPKEFIEAVAALASDG